MNFDSVLVVDPCHYFCLLLLHEPRLPQLSQSLWTTFKFYPEITEYNPHSLKVITKMAILNKPLKKSLWQFKILNILKSYSSNPHPVWTRLIQHSKSFLDKPIKKILDIASLIKPVFCIKKESLNKLESNSKKLWTL